MTTTGELLQRLDWTPPGPGSWTLDKTHVPRPATAHLQRVVPAFSEGFEASAAAYGWLIGKFNITAVNGFVYSNVQIVDLDEMPERFQRCEQAFATKRWRAEVERWDSVVKPAALAAHRDLLAVDLEALDDADLSAYLHRCHDHHAEMWRQHHRFNGTHMVPVGDFVVGASEWTGLPPVEIAGLLRGSSPISRGWCPETEALVEAIRAVPEASDILTEDDAEVVLDRLHRVNDDVATALEAWLTVTGNRPVDGFDIADPTGIEIPAMMVSCIRNALAPRAPEVDDAEVDRVRALVPADRRDDFDDRLAEARHCYRIRDERGIYSDALACGIVRRALLATGRRLERRGRLPRAVLAIDATIEELVELLDAPDPSLIAVLEDRALFRSSLTISDAPPFLGEPPGEPPSFDALPEHAARMMKALVGVNANDVSAGTTTAEPTGERVLQGVPASPGIHRGVARVVLSPDDLDRLEEGDVLVTITTGEAFNIAIAMVSALVTDQGSLMSHAGITAREYGIPAVVGASAATTQIPDGAVIEVDGSAGTIRWT